MVLKRLAGLGLVALLGLSGCLAHAQLVRLAHPAPVAVAYLQDDALKRQSTAVPEVVSRDLDALLAARNLAPVHLPPATWLPRLGRMRATSARLAALARGAGDAPYVLLVEVQPAFYSQLNGRYRWTVDLRATVAPTGDLAAAVSTSAQLPVFLLYDHERDAAAVRAVDGLIADRVSALVDDFLASRQPSPGGGGSGGARARGSGGDHTAGALTGRTPAPRGNTWRPAPPPPGDVIYFAMVDRFADGDRSNDAGVDRSDPSAWHGGDVAGILQHLDWLKSLGVTTLWLSPVYDCRHAKLDGHGAFHGYWVFDPLRPDPKFGSFAELRKLSDALHARGMRLLLDVVVNHLGYDAPLVTRHPDWFHHQGDITDWNDPAQLVDHDVHGLPDLAQEKPAVYAWLMKRAQVWIRKVHPDGFRLDAVKHVPLSFWRRYDTALRRRHGDGFFLLGEDLDGDAAHLAHTERAGAFTSLFDFPLHFALVDVFCKGAPPARLASILSLDRLYPRPNALVTLLDNHDLPRITTACHGDLGRVRRALETMLALRGIPSITWGTEDALTGAHEPANRGDMRFAPQAPLKAELAGDVAFRRDHPALTVGLTRVVDLGPGRLALLRLARGDAVLLAMNQGKAKATVPLPPAFAAASGVETVTVPAGGLVRRALPPRRVEGYRALVARWRAGGTVDHPGPRRPVTLTASGAPARAGDTVVVVGAGPELGAWSPARAPAVGKDHRAHLAVPAGLVLAFKLAVRHPDGTVTWSPGGNHYLLVPASGAAHATVAW